LRWDARVELCEGASRTRGNRTELVRAAIAGHTNDVHAVLDSLERHSTPQARLKALFRALTDQSDLTARYGCPLGSLCSELDKRTDGLDQTGAQMLRLPVDWAEQQFRLMGRRDARDLTVAMIGSTRESR
jgi:TetR/AcrR family transcriptional regulator, transcriptional repressor for nem operon